MNKKIRPQSNVATQLCPVLLPALRLILGPTTSALSSLFSARWFWPSKELNPSFDVNVSSKKLLFYLP